MRSRSTGLRRGGSRKARWLLKQHSAFPRFIGSRSRGGGDAGRIPSPTAVCVKEKTQTRVVTARSGGSPASRSARGLYRECRKRHARSHSRRQHAMVYGLLRMTPGGLTLLSTAGGSSRFRRSTHWHAPARDRQVRPCDARQARRDHSTSAAAFRLSRKRLDAATASGPHRATRCAMPCSKAGTRGVYVWR
jgi:hypothetical protein